jgi:hypothetical protein
LRNFRRRIQMAMEADDAHIENMFTWLLLSQDFWTERHHKYNKFAM